MTVKTESTGKEYGEFRFTNNRRTDCEQLNGLTALRTELNGLTANLKKSDGNRQH